MTYQAIARDPAHAAALQHMQKGEWTPALEALSGLAERFPNDYELQEFVAEARVRANIDQNEKDDRKRAIKLRLAGWALRLAVLALIVYGGWVGYERYSLALNAQMAEARQYVEAQAAAFQLATKYADAQALLRAGRLHEAQLLLTEVAAVDPAYPGLHLLLAQINTLDTLDAQYAQAAQLIQVGDWQAALPVLQAITRADANYLDSAMLLAEAERQVLLAESLAEAEAYFQAGAWADAAAAFEGLRAVDPSFRDGDIQDRLFDSYVQAGRAALVDQEDSLEALRTAESYFRKALALRPKDPDVKAERELARLFLLAQKDFDEARWSAAITSLEIVHAVDPGYAKGAAGQTLYEARVSRGDAAMVQGSYESALADYRAALALAEKRPEAVLRLYEAYLRAGDAYAAQRQFEPAVLMYRQAIEAGAIKERAEENTFMAESIQRAEAALEASNFTLAFEHYRAAITGADATQATLVHVVQAGEYLILIATRYRSTVQSIVAANEIVNPRLIYAGQELVIPVQP
jgi:tetratricopeptide (TPR) repeat protein